MKTMTKIVVLVLVACLLFTGCKTTDTKKAEEKPADANLSNAPAATAAENNKPAEAERKLKDTMTIVLRGEPSNIDPHNNLELNAFTVQMQIYDTLVTRDNDGNIHPSLATHWDQIDDVTTRFYLRDDVYFHNGDKMTAEDVLYTVQRACRMSSSSAIFAAVDGDKCKVVDDYTIDIVTKGPFAALLNYISSTRGGIVPKKVVEAVGDDEFGRNPIGTGAFKFDSWLTGTQVILKRNENYWGEKPTFSTMVFKFIAEDATRAIELETGMADVIFNPAATDTERMKQEPDKYTVLIGDSYMQMKVSFNLSDEITGNVLVRKALSYALDTPLITESEYGEFAQPAGGIMANAIDFYKELGVQEYNPEYAKQLLAEAGYPDGFTLVFGINNSKESYDIAEIVQNMWGEIGVKVDIKISAQPEFMAAAIRGEYQAVASSASFTTGDPGHALKDWRTDTVGTAHAVDKKVDEMLDDAAITFDAAERQKKYEDIQQYLHDDYVCIPIATKKVVYITSAKVENFNASATSTPYMGGSIIYE